MLFAVVVVGRAVHCTCNNFYKRFVAEVRLRFLAEVKIAIQTVAIPTNCTDLVDLKDGRSDRKLNNSETLAFQTLCETSWKNGSVDRWSCENQTRSAS